MAEATSYPEDKPTTATDTSLKKVSSIEKDVHSDDDASYIQGSEGVTEHDLATHRHVADTLPWTAWLVLIAEFAERWTYYGTINIFNNYIRFRLPPNSIDGSVPKADRLEGVAGALGLGVQKSFAIRTFNSFLVYVTPILGAIVADCYLGRYNTILLFSVVCILGHVILVASATPHVLESPNTSLGLLILSIIVSGIGAGSIKSNVSPMVAEQYQGKLRKETLPSGEVVIKSPTLTIQSIYLWFYCAINFGSTAAISASFIARDHGYWAAFLLPTCVFALVPGVLILGRKHYVKTPPRGSILLETMRVINMSLGPAWSVNPIQTVRNIRKPDFWAPSRPSTYAGRTMPARITWDEEFVGEVSRTLNACLVFLFFPFYWLCYSQIDGNYGTMAGAMTLKGTPNDLIQNLNPISIIIMIPIFDKVIYPFLRKKGINFTPLKRIATGFLVAGLAMVYAAVVQHYLYKTNPCGDLEPSECRFEDGQPNHSPLNVWIISGPYILVGMSEIFASITSLEYAYTKAPVRMKSVVMSIAQFQNALSSAINFALVDVNTEPKFLWLFTSFAVVSWTAGCLFYLCFRKLDAREIELNAIGQGERAGFADEGVAVVPGTVLPSQKA